MKDGFNIADLFVATAKKYPEKNAIITNRNKISFGTLYIDVQLTAQHFQKKGIKKGDNVLVFVPMSVDLYRITLALFHIGAIPVFLDEWVNKSRMEACCKVADPNAFVGVWKARIFSYFSKELRKIPIKLGTSFSVSSAISIKQETQKMNASDTALITFTTGSTGIPKAANRTHGFLKAQFEALIDTINPRTEDVVMSVLPIVLLMNLGVGCTSVIAEFKASKPTSMQPNKIANQLKVHNVNRLISSPYFLKTLSLYCTKNKVKIDPLKHILTGGAPVFPKEASIYSHAFPQAKIEILYGSTEAEPISEIQAEELIQLSEITEKKGLPVGTVYVKCKVKIIKISDEPIECKNEEELNSLVLPTGEIGEIIVSGKHVLNSYINNPEAIVANKIFIGDTCWHRTGDSGYMNNANQLFLTGRHSALITHNGTLISPFLWENKLQQINQIEMGTILKIKGKIMLVLETEKGANRELIKETIQKLAFVEDFEIHFVSEIPRDPRHHSKVDYGNLRLMIEAEDR